MADDPPPPVTPKNEKHASLISREEPIRGMAQSIAKPKNYKPPEPSVLSTIFQLIVLIALLGAIATIIGFGAYWLFSR